MSSSFSNFTRISAKVAAATILLAITVVLVIFEPLWGVVLVIIEVTGLIAYYGRTKCENCGARGSFLPSEKETLKQEKGYGIVTRTDRVSRRKSSYDDEDFYDGSEFEDTTIEREERVPVVRTTWRFIRKCAKCGYMRKSDNTYTDEQEDFTVPSARPIREREITREVLRIPCAHCGTLNDPVRRQRCTSCGAPLLSR